MRLRQRFREGDPDSGLDSCCKLVFPAAETFRVCRRKGDLQKRRNRDLVDVKGTKSGSDLDVPESRVERVALERRLLVRKRLLRAASSDTNPSR